MRGRGDELNLDGIVGLSHNYSGLAYGNVASIKNEAMPSNPKAAALQGLAKMKFLADQGILQAVMPPQERPNIEILRRLGFSGSDGDVLKKVYQEHPDLFFACCSASSMWTANAATVSPSADSADGKVHITPANLLNKCHRSIETTMTAKCLKKIFYDSHHFVHHEPLFSSDAFSDEGAANHSRFCKEFIHRGIELFVYGRSALRKEKAPKKYPARQTIEASQAIARLHQLSLERTLFIQQNPEAIDAGVFHNDVISLAHQHLFLYHEKAFVDTNIAIAQLEAMAITCGFDLKPIPVSQEEITLEEAVSSYLFNSQIVTRPNQTMLLIAPKECEEISSVKLFLDRLQIDPTNPIDSVHYFDLRESMRNGGGPACLRLRLVLTPKELRSMHPKVLLNDELYLKLVQWVKKHYREQLLPSDLADPQFLYEEQNALDQLTQILSLGSLYSFQCQ